MHSLGHLMTSEGEKQFVLIVFLLGQFVITATSATRFRNSGSPVKVPEEQTGSRCSHLIHIFDHIFGICEDRSPLAPDLIHLLKCRQNPSVLPVDVLCRAKRPFGPSANPASATTEAQVTDLGFCSIALLLYFGPGNINVTKVICIYLTMTFLVRPSLVLIIFRPL